MLTSVCDQLLSLSAIADMSEPIPSECLPLEYRAECGICSYTLPLDPKQSVYESCCGQIICQGCVVASRKAKIRMHELMSLQESMPDVPRESLEFQIMTNSKNIRCAYCRGTRPNNCEELVQRLCKRVEKFNDAVAMNQLGDCYMKGLHGVDVDVIRGIELYKKSYELGSSDAAHRLWYYSPEEEKKQYLDEGVRRNNLHSMFERGKECLRHESLDKEEAIRLISNVYKAGYTDAFDTLFQMCKDGVITANQVSRLVGKNRKAINSLDTETRKYAMRFISYLSTLNT